MRGIVYFLSIWIWLACTAGTCIRTENDQRKNGTFREYHENGKLAAEINYKDGKLHGILRKWYDNGQLHDSSYFKNGEPVGYSVSYYRNGKKNYENYWSEAHKLDSISRFWYDNGKIGNEGYYQNGKLHGEWRMYYKNGRLESIINYDRGDKQGKSIYFNENGDTSRVELYEKGKLVKSS